MARRILITAAACGLLGLNACDSVPVQATAARTLATVTITATPYATGLDQPVDITRNPADGILYVAERTGTVRALTAAGRVLTLRVETTTNGDRGLVGIAFSPDGSKLYASYTNLSGDRLVREYPMVAGFQADTTRARTLLNILHSSSALHVGGGIEVDSTGLLYLGMGDGDTGDGGAVGQRIDAFHGKILRIDPRPSAGRAYTIPADNPFVDTPGGAPEVWAYGLRNPWRFSFDSATGDLFIADVGSKLREEINVDHVPLDAGRNYGWNLTEGTLGDPSGARSPITWPVYDYESQRNDDCAVTGGAVVRSTKPDLGALDGAYVFADFCSGRIRGLRVVDNSVVDFSWQLGSVPMPVAFEASSGELFAVSITGTVFRLRAS